MFETSGGSPTLGAYGDCCSCCANVRVATPPRARTLASMLAPYATSVLVIVVASLWRPRARAFSDFVRIEPNTGAAGDASPHLPQRHARSCVGVERALAYNRPAAQRWRQVAQINRAD